MAAIQIEAHIVVPQGAELPTPSLPFASHQKFSIPISSSGSTLESISEGLDTAREQVNAFTTQCKDYLGPYEVQLAAKRKNNPPDTKRANADLLGGAPDEDDHSDEDEEDSDEQ